MHALNAARVFARHIKYSSIHVQAQQQKTTKNGKGLGSQEKFAICCRSLPILWDYMFEVTRIYPRWCKYLTVLRWFISWNVLPSNISFCFADAKIPSCRLDSAGDSSVSREVVRLNTLASFFFDLLIRFPTSLAHKPTS